jgi:hypothetical protein
MIAGFSIAIGHAWLGRDVQLCHQQSAACQGLELDGKSHFLPSGFGSELADVEQEVSVTTANK